MKDFTSAKSQELENHQRAGCLSLCHVSQVRNSNVSKIIIHMCDANICKAFQYVFFLCGVNHQLLKKVLWTFQRTLVQDLKHFKHASVKLLIVKFILNLSSNSVNVYSTTYLDSHNERSHCAATTPWIVVTILLSTLIAVVGLYHFRKDLYRGKKRGKVLYN